MLRVLIYETRPELRAMLADIATSLSHRVRIGISTDSADLVERAVMEEQGISLTILGLSLRNEDNEHVLSLGRRIMKRNRENYTVYLMPMKANLQSILMRCDRPAAILLEPLTREAVANCLERIVQEYAEISQDTDLTQMLNLSTPTKTWRVPFDRISHIEALDKKLVIYTNNNAITCRYSMNSLIEMLPESFARCHRSYVVNMNYVRHYSAETAELTLSGGERIPISRTARQAIKQRMEEMGGKL